MSNKTQTRQLHKIWINIPERSKDIFEQKRTVWLTVPQAEYDKMKTKNIRKEINRFLAKPHLLTKRLSHTENPHFSHELSATFLFGEILVCGTVSAGCCTTPWLRGERAKTFLFVLLSSRNCLHREVVLLPFFCFVFISAWGNSWAAPVFFEVKRVQWNRYLSQLGASSCEMMRLSDMIMFDDEVFVLFFVSLGD